MGMFSYLCKGCGQELIEGELVRLNGCKGEYDGYGRAGGFESLGSSNVVAWHDRCHKTATQTQRDDETPSKGAKDQGFGPAHMEFMPGYEPDYSCKYTISIRGCTKEDQERKDFRETLFVLTTKGWVDATLWEEAANKGTDLPPHAAAMNLSDPLSSMAQLDTLDRAIEDAHEFVIALRDGAADVKRVLEAYTIHVFGQQGPFGRNRLVKGMVYEYERREVVKFSYGEVPQYVPTGKYEEGITYRIGSRLPELMQVPESSKPQLAQVLLKSGTPAQQKEAKEWLRSIWLVEVPPASKQQREEARAELLRDENPHLDAIEASIEKLKQTLDRLQKNVKSLSKKKAKAPKKK
jgi:hypothetical protein